MVEELTPFERLLAEMHGPPPKPYEHKKLDAGLAKLVELVHDVADEIELGDE